MRVYFASYLNDDSNPDSDFILPGQEDNLTLIFVPTRTVTRNNMTLHQDDITNCLIIVNNQYQKLLTPSTNPNNPDTASDWIRYFQQSRIPDLENDGMPFTNNPYFKETRSTWYSLKTIKDPDGKPDLITFINCLMGGSGYNPLVSVIARFACYVPDDKPFSLLPVDALVFDLHQKNDGMSMVDNAFGSNKSTG